MMNVSPYFGETTVTHEYLTNSTDLTAVADAIRAKGGTTAQLVYPDGFVSAIQAISTGKQEQTKTVNIASNGQLTVTPDDGYTLSSVVINTNVSSGGIDGEYVGSFILSDGILKFSVPQEDYSNYRNYYIKKSSVPFGLFMTNMATGTMSDTWMVTHETSSTINFSSDYVTVSQVTAYYNFVVNLADSSAQYYEGGVEVYVITA